MKLKFLCFVMLTSALFFTACSTGSDSSSSDSKSVTYSITYDPNGATAGTVPSDPKGYDANSSAIVLDNTGNLTKGTDSFWGWYTTKDTSGKFYAPGDQVNIDSDNIVLYAYWIPSASAKTLTNLIGSTWEGVRQLSYQPEYGGDYREELETNDFTFNKNLTAELEVKDAKVSKFGTHITTMVISDKKTEFTYSIDSDGDITLTANGTSTSLTDIQDTRFTYNNYMFKKI